MTDVGFSAALSINGVQTVLGNFLKFQVAANAGFRAGMQEVVDKIYEDSQFEVPVDKGDLKGTGDKLVVVMFGATPNTLTVVGEVSYGKGIDYAVYVHEDMTKHHDPPTKAKFLEDPVKKRLSNGELVTLFQSKLITTLVSNYGVAP